MQLNVKALVIAGGIFWGVTLFWEILMGGILGLSILWASPEVARMIVSIYPDITFTMSGVFLALVYGFLCGALCGGIFGWLYNWALKKTS